MTRNELDSLITFKMGLPSLYHIMLGMAMDETDDYEKEIENRQTDNYDLNDFLKKYSIVVERTAFTGEMRLEEMTITIPLEYIKEKDLQKLFDYFVNRMDVVEKRLHFTSNSNDDICELDILLRSSLYDVRITKNENGDRAVITFASEDVVNLDKLRCLAIIANNESNFAKELFEYLENVN